MIALKRLFTSIDFIEQLLYDKISVDAVARSANYSTYHYCRIFKAIVGESVMTYVRKRRLTEAADLLAKTTIPMLEIAIQCQFDSQEVFIRAFKNQFNETPGKYRKLNERFQLLYKKKFDTDSLKHRNAVLNLQPEIITKPAVAVIGLSTIYQYENFDIMKMWAVFKEHQAEIPNMLPDTCGFGIYENYQENNTEDGETIFTHKGLVDNIDITLRYIWGDWLPTSQCAYANKPDFEIYSNRYISNNKKSEIDLYIPVKEK